MSIEDRFDIPLVANMALREKQIQQRYRPIIAVHKWFARRPGTLFRALLLAEFDQRPLTESYFLSHDFSGLVVADPFMGGGTPILEANRVGCDVIGFDVNPMATWIVRQEIEDLDLEAYRDAAGSLVERLEAEIGTEYRTDCPLYGDSDVPVKYYLWVKAIDCEHCGHEIRLFPGYLVARDRRHPYHVLVCAHCGELNEVRDPQRPGKCRACAEILVSSATAGRSRCACASCGRENRYPQAGVGPPRHRMFAIEYYNPHRKSQHRGRFFKKPDLQDLARYERAAARWAAMEARFVPDEHIPSGDETERLHRWGYRLYRQLFNDRQLLGLELSARLIAQVCDRRIRHALATNFSDLLRYQNMLCRYDTAALKSLDVFSVHGFPAGLIQCESNLLGIRHAGGACVGSGGWANIVDKFHKAKAYCDNPFEVRGTGSKRLVYTRGEWIGEEREDTRPRRVTLHCCSSTEVELEPCSLDAVFTDPPYLANVQYGELMDFCYVWLRRIVRGEAEGFDRQSTRSPDDLTGNTSQGRGVEHFAEGLSRVFSAMGRALKPDAPLAFTFHHNQAQAYYAVGVAILDANLDCSATLPCPAEMGGSIHIHGTTSSIVDTVFVCRLRAAHQELIDAGDRSTLEAIAREHLAELQAAGLKPSAGDIRCILMGHVTRVIIAKLSDGWDRQLPINERLTRFRDAAQSLGDIDSLVDELATSVRPQSGRPSQLLLFSEGVSR